MALFLATIIVFAGASVAQVIVGIGTGMADIADENELATGRRQEGVFFGASAFANKCSAALGSFFAGLFLEWIHWPVGSEVRTAADIPADTLLQLAIVSGPVVSLLAIPGILCLRGYKLNRGRLVEIQNELQASSSPSVVSES
jgi:Na+/melibiose symporter-like transporter